MAAQLAQLVKITLHHDMTSQLISEKPLPTKWTSEPSGTGGIWVSQDDIGGFFSQLAVRRMVQYWVSLAQASTASFAPGIGHTRSAQKRGQRGPCSCAAPRG